MLSGKNCSHCGCEAKHHIDTSKHHITTSLCTKGLCQCPEYNMQKSEQDDG